MAGGQLLQRGAAEQPVSFPRAPVLASELSRRGDVGRRRPEPGRWVNTSSSDLGAAGLPTALPRSKLCSELLNYAGGRAAGLTASSASLAQGNEVPTLSLGWDCSALLQLSRHKLLQSAREPQDFLPQSRRYMLSQLL